MRITVFKGGVQRKIRWINNNVNRWELAGTFALDIFFDIVSFRLGVNTLFIRFWSVEHN
jgi:hypothetical protein